MSILIAQAVRQLRQVLSLHLASMLLILIPTIMLPIVSDNVKVDISLAALVLLVLLILISLLERPEKLAKKCECMFVWLPIVLRSRVCLNVLADL